MYKPTIGLEIHAELKTQTKMFCDSRNDPHEAIPNTHVCPICMGHPGTLPTINFEAVRHVCRVGVAVGGTLADFSEFDRKNYFYPDIPKGYQISQYKYPLVSGGTLAGVALTRIHLEEDTAKSTHIGEESLIDFNRAGVPLMELVTEPVIHSAQEVGEFARELQRLLRTLGVSDANLEKGEMRIEVNISISKDDTLGTKVEVKNINSFRAAERAVEYEITRHTKALEAGESLVQETRGWDESAQKTFAQRIKEGAADYRYFPEPDLPKLKLSEVPELNIDVLKASLPELPWERRARYQVLGISDEDVTCLLATPERTTFFDALLTDLSGSAIKRATNYITSDIVGYSNLHSEAEAFAHLTPEAFVELIHMLEEGELSSRGAKDVLAVLLAEGGKAREVAEAKGLFQMSDASALEGVVRDLIDEHAAVVAEYREGKEAALQFLIGQGMKKTRGAANPEALKELLKAKITAA